MLGNNLKTVEIILTEVIEKDNSLKGTWKSLSYRDLYGIFEKYKFTKIKIPFQIYDKERKQIIKELIKLKKEYFKIEKIQIESGMLTNSEMDELIYKAYSDFVGDMHYMYGELSDREIENRRQLIIESINLYKQKQNET